MTIEKEAREIVKHYVMTNFNGNVFVPDILVSDIAKALKTKQDRIDELEQIRMKLISKNTDLSMKVVELESALKRLASLEAFTSPRMIDKALDCELVARIDFAKKAIGGGNERNI